MTGGPQSDPGGSPRGAQPPGERAWQHPSEVGLANRGRTDRRRTTLVAAGVLISGLGLLVTGMLLGSTDSADPDMAAPSPVDEASRSVAHVTLVDEDGSTMVTGLVLDDAGHVLIPAAALDGVREVWARCDGGVAEEVQVIGRDADTGLAVLQFTEPMGTPATVAESRPGSDAEVVAMYAKGGKDVMKRSGALVPTQATVTLLRAEVSDRPEDGRTSSGDDLVGGLLFDSGGHFVGMATDVAEPASSTGDSNTSTVDVMPAAAAMQSAHRIIAAS